jgi:hypothetical protein
MDLLKAHGIKVVALLTALHAFLTALGANPLIASIGAAGARYLTFALALVTAVLTFLSPGTPVSASGGTAEKPPASGGAPPSAPHKAS